MADKQVVIYSTPTCPYCKRAREYLTRRNIPFREYNVAADRKAAKEMVKKSGQFGVPVITVDGEVLIGFHHDRLEEMISRKPAEEPTV